jgi:hypothetical protein
MVWCIGGTRRLPGCDHRASILWLAPEVLPKAGQEQGKWVTQSDVAETGNVTPTTMRTHHETLDKLAV